MKARIALGALAALLLLSTTVARAQVLPPPPPIPEPPEELQPLLEVLAPVGGTVTQPGCAALGTVLGLGALAIPGLPGTIEQQTGLPLSSLPIALQPELLAFVNTLLYVQGSGCGLLPLAAERTVCASDDEFAAAVNQVRAQLNLPGLPVNVGDFVPTPEPSAGSVIDTFHVLALLGILGARDVADALDAAGDCELRNRFANVEPPPIPPDPVTPPIAPPPGGPQEIPETAAPPARATPSAPAPPPVIGSPGTGPTTAPIAALPLPVTEHLPRWLQWLVVAALVAFLYRAVAPRRDQSQRGTHLERV